MNYRDVEVGEVLEMIKLGQPFATCKVVSKTEDYLFASWMGITVMIDEGNQDQFRRMKDEV